jgi:hypothetical protein
MKKLGSYPANPKNLQVFDTHRSGNILDAQSSCLVHENPAKSSGLTHWPLKQASPRLHPVLEKYEIRIIFLIELPMILY